MRAQLSLCARRDPGAEGEIVVFRHVLKPAGRVVAGASIVAATATTLALFTVTAANAAGTVTPTPSSAPNSAVKNISFATADTWAAAQPPTVTVTRTGASSDALTVSNVTVTGPVSGSTVTADVDFTLANPGSYDVTITGAAVGPPPNPSASDSCSGCLTATDASPLTVSSAAPNEIQASSLGASSAKVVVTGTGFARGTTVSVVDGSNNPVAGVTVSNTSPATANTATTITKNFTVASNAAPGAYNLMVTNTDGSSHLCPSCFTVVAAMQVTSVTPSTLQVGSSGQTLSIAGSNFPSDAVAVFKHTNGSSASELTIGSQSVSSNSTITLNNVSVSSGATPQALDLYISSASESSTDKFTGKFATVAPPHGTGVTYASNPSPNQRQDYGQGAGTGAEDVIFVVNGSNFVADGSTPGTRVTISPSGGVNYDVTTETATTTAVTIHLSIDATAPTGNRTLTITNPDGSSTTCDNHTNVNPNT